MTISGIGGIDACCPPSPQECGQATRTPERDALAACEPAHGHSRLPRLDVIQAYAAVPVQALDQRRAQRDRLREPEPRSAVQAAHAGCRTRVAPRDEIVPIQCFDQLDFFRAASGTAPPVRTATPSSCTLRKTVMRDGPLTSPTSAAVIPSLHSISRAVRFLSFIGAAGAAGTWHLMARVVAVLHEKAACAGQSRGFASVGRVCLRTIRISGIAASSLATQNATKPSSDTVIRTPITMLPSTQAVP